MTASSLHRRARQIRARAITRAWAYRQRHHAKGVWFRFRRVLVDAARAWIISDGEADELEREGCSPAPAGAELHPPKRLFMLCPDRVAALATRREVRVTLSAELLAARNLVLVPHDVPETE